MKNIRKWNKQLEHSVALLERVLELYQDIAALQKAEMDKFTWHKPVTTNTAKPLKTNPWNI